MPPLSALVVAAALPQLFTRLAPAPEDFCFPPLSSFTVRVSPLQPNSTLMAIETFVLGAEARRVTLQISGTPFGGGLPPGQVDGGIQNIIDDYATKTQWHWYSLAGQVYCSKSAGDDVSVMCIGGGMTQNATRTVGGRKAYSWVGYDASTLCWNELVIGSVESSDPAEWLSATGQCTGAGSQQSLVQSLAFSDYSIGPLPPDAFKLPPECPK